MTIKMTTTTQSIQDIIESVDSIISNSKSVKRAFNTILNRLNKIEGRNFYYAYHEDGEYTWRSGWSESDYKNDDEDIKVVEYTGLMQKKKASRRFSRSQTYTSEYAHFIFESKTN